MDPKDPEAKPKFISPSRVARFYFLECERYLRYTSTPNDQRPGEDIPPVPFDTRPVTQAILESGFVWEEKVVGDYIADRVHIAKDPEAIDVRDRIFSAEQSRELLSTIEPGNFIYQPTLPTLPTFYERYGISPTIVQFTDSRPDLIECVTEEDGTIALRVIDIKASPGLKLSHRIQATMYSLILDHALRHWEISDRTVSDTGGIWLSEVTSPEYFDVRSIRPPLESFLERDLQPLMERPADQARWHLYYRCEWCDFYQHCHAEMQANNDVSRVPYLSGYAKRFLSTLDPPVSTVDEFEELVNDERRNSMLEDAASLRGRVRQLQKQTAALRTDTVLTFGGSSLAMPKAEHVRVVLTIQNEPVSGKVYAYAIYAQGLRDVLGENPKPYVQVANEPEEVVVADLERQLVLDLHDLLSAVHDFNDVRSADWGAQKTLQAYSFDTYEWDLLTEVLLRRITDPEVSEQALQVFFYFQQPELVQAEDHPANEVFFPVVVLSAVLRELFALPLEVTYRFRDVVNLLRPSTFAFDYQGSDWLSFELSNRMRSDAIFDVWHRGKDYVARIERELKNRVWATNSLINGIREHLAQGDSLFAWAPKFRLPERFGYRHLSLSRLAFLARYESVLGYLDTRLERMGPREERIQSGNSLLITYDRGDRFLLDPVHRDIEIGASGFPSWLLTEDSEPGTRARLSYNDYANRDRVWVPKNSPVALAGITSLESSIELPNQALRLDLKMSQSMPPIKEGQTYFLDKRFTDFNSDRTVSELQEIDSEPDPFFVQLIDTPHGAVRPVPTPKEILESALALGREYGMTQSQTAAFEGVLRRNVQLVWGPPGTGKTHFLALAILCLSEAHQRAGQPFRVLLSAFTHAAIDNCLRKAAELQNQHGIVAGEFPIGKLKKKQLAEMDDIELVSDKDGGPWFLGTTASLLGGTAWSIRKCIDPNLADLVVVDEASQLEVPDSSIVIRRMQDEGRLLIAGDDRQLPPIVQGTYPDPGEGEPLLHRSLFECLRAADMEANFTSTLLENFRMNRVLCRYPAEQIYVPDYDSATDRIATRRLQLLDGPSPDEITGELVDPDFPLVVCVMEGIRATAENRVEAELVAKVANELRRRMVNDQGQPYLESPAGDADFWEHGLFVVSPHHAQINTVQQALKRSRTWLSLPFVDTVDKMQGQECDAVVATYGVSDVEYAMSEKEFIYSLNRLNVAITRARAKTIVFLPLPLIEPPIAAFEDDRIAEGIAFMQGLVQFAERGGSQSTHSLGAPGALLRILRVGFG